MSVRVKTQPVEPITVSGASSAPVPEVSADVFRGVFLDLVTDGELRDTNYFAAQSPGYTGTYIVRRTGSVPHGVMTLGAGDGVNGGDCPKLTFNSKFFTVSGAPTTTISSTAHGLADGTPVGVATQYGGTLPTGLVNSSSSSGGSINFYYIRNGTTDTFELDGPHTDGINPTPNGSSVTLTTNGSGTHRVCTTNHTSMWIGRGEYPGQYINSGTDKMLGPISGRPYNTFEVKVRTSPGIFANRMDDDVGQTWNTGCYNNSASASGAGAHTYFQSIVRYADASEGEWITVRNRGCPSYYIGVNQYFMPPEVFPTLNDGPFWNTETRLYLDIVTYFSDPEVSESYSTYFDRARIYYTETRYPGVSMAWDSLDSTSPVTIVRDGSTVHQHNFTITNTSGSSLSGYIWAHALNYATNQVRNSTNSDVTGTEITVPAGGVWQGSHYAVYAAGSQLGVSGVTFVPTAEYNTASGQIPNAIQKNHSDTRVTRTPYATPVLGEKLGPYDAETFQVVYQCSFS